MSRRQLVFAPRSRRFFESVPGRVHARVRRADAGCEIADADAGFHDAVATYARTVRARPASMRNALGPFRPCPIGTIYVDLGYMHDKTRVRPVLEPQQ